MGAFGRERARTTLSWENEAPHLLAAYAALFAGFGAPAATPGESLSAVPLANVTDQGGEKR